jgi:hypothetical protein
MTLTKERNTMNRTTKRKINNEILPLSNIFITRYENKVTSEMNLSMQITLILILNANVHFRHVLSSSWSSMNALVFHSRFLNFGFQENLTEFNSTTTHESLRRFHYFISVNSFNLTLELQYDKIYRISVPLGLLCNWQDRDWNLRLLPHPFPLWF